MEGLQGWSLVLSVEELVVGPEVPLDRAAWSMELAHLGPVQVE
jgi:hypothetical protein